MKHDKACCLWRYHIDSRYSWRAWLLFEDVVTIIINNLRKNNNDFEKARGAVTVAILFVRIFTGCHRLSMSKSIYICPIVLYAQLQYNFLLLRTSFQPINRSNRTRRRSYQGSKVNYFYVLLRMYCIVQYSTLCNLPVLKKKIITYYYYYYYVL